jgi:integrase
MSRGHIRKQGEGSWEIKFDLGRDPMTGKRLTRYLTFRGTKRAAEAELTRLLSRRDDGVHVDPTKMNLGEYLHHWLTANIERRVAARTAHRHRGIVEKNIIPRLGNIPLRKLTAVHIEAFEADLQREGRVNGKGGLSAQTVKHVHRTLSQALRHAVRQNVLVKNPAEAVQPPRPEDREIVILSKPEIGTILSAAQGTELFVPILVGVTTGVRRGELLALRWSDLDLDAGYLIVNQALEQVGRKITFKPPKNKKSRRKVTLPDTTTKALRQYRKTQAEERLRMGLPAAARTLVFSRPNGEPLDPDAVSKAFKRIVSTAKVTPISLHGLRHTHISHLLMDGVHAKVVSERAGHSTVAFTLSRYAAYIPNLQQDAAERVDAALRDVLK